VVGHLLVAVADRQGAGGLEEEDRRTPVRLGPVLDAARDHEHRSPLQGDDPLRGALALAQPDAQVPVQEEEELVGTVVGVPHVLAADLGHAHVVVVDPGDDARTPQLVEGGQRVPQVDRSFAHRAILAMAPRPGKC
jgi:aminoglycoside/choline kinase family phosphotransferase